jgi:protein O-mannosyl-transferase
MLYLTTIIFITSFAVYFTAIFDGFVYDDNLQIVQNPWIKEVKYFSEIFANSVWSFQGDLRVSNYYRPMMHMVYMLNYHLFGLTPWGFHLINILFHAGVSCLVFILTVTFFREHMPSPASVNSYVFSSFAAALLFATHPVHTEAVTWIAGLPEVSFTFFYLLSLYLYIRSTADRDKIRYLSSAALFCLAVLFKETALTLPLILIIYDYVFGKIKGPPSASLKRYIPYFLVTGAYFLLRFHALGGIAPQKRHADLDTFQLFINIFPLFTQYLEKLLFPVNLNAFHVFHPIASIFDIKGFVSLVILSLYLAITFIARRRNALFFFSLTLIVVPLLPVFYIPALGENTFAERYLYLPSVGFTILTALLIVWITASFPKIIPALNLVVVLLIGLYSIGTISRNTIWKSDYELFTDTVKKSPDGAIPHSSLASTLFNRGQIDEAIDHYQVALELQPRRAEDEYNLGVAYEQKGLTDMASEQYEIASLAPGFAKPHNNLGILYARKGLLDEAIEHFQIAIRLQPTYAIAHHNLGAAYEEKGLVDMAIEQYQIAAGLDPDNRGFRDDLAKIMRRERRDEEIN